MKTYVYCLLLIHSHSVLRSEDSMSEKGKMLIKHVETSIANAEKQKSNLSAGVLKIDGMSSSKVRHFLNNLCSLPNTHYLEIGCWKGSTFISSLFGNSATVMSAVAIDNWSQYGDVRKDFYDNCSLFLPPNIAVICESDCFKFDPKSVCDYPVNIYFYDGDHTALAQELAFNHYNAVFDDVFIAVVDDWNHPPVSLGTKTAFKKLGYRVLFEKVLPARWNADVENWWNGLYVAVIRKNK